MRIAVVGARGQLGAALVDEFGRGHHTIQFDRAALELTDASAVLAALDSARPDVIVNAAAFNAVDAAEDQAVDALQVNAFAVRTLARAARVHAAALVHYSTDFVFDGTAAVPYTEADKPNPRSVYGASKLLGEWFAADAPRAYVVRVESLFGRAPGGVDKGSVAAIVAALREGRAPRVFVDRTVTPTYVIDAARATRHLVERGVPSGVYHCVNSGACTWQELALEAARLLAVEPRVEAVRLADVKLRAPRPLYCAMSNAKLASQGVEMPSWQAALAAYVLGH